MTPPTPDAIGQQLAALERERAARHAALDAEYNVKMVALRAEIVRRMLRERQAA